MTQENNLVNIIVFDMQYRDGGNWKTGHQQYFQDSERMYSEEWLKEFFKKNVSHFEDPFYAQYYNLESIAPVENEFTEGGTYDHCFMEVLDISIKKDQEPAGYDEISEWISYIQDLTKEDVQQMEHENRKLAAKNYSSKLNKLIQQL